MNWTQPASDPLADLAAALEPKPEGAQTLVLTRHQVRLLRDIALASGNVRAARQAQELLR
jgi:hypothetical protein